MGRNMNSAMLNIKRSVSAQNFSFLFNEKKQSISVCFRALLKFPADYKVSQFLATRSASFGVHVLHGFGHHYWLMRTYSFLNNVNLKNTFHHHHE